MTLLNTKLPKYLKDLAAVYKQQNEPFKHEILSNCRWFLRENTDHDNWNGGMDGHTVVLFVPIEIIAKVAIKERNEISREIHTDLSDLNTAEADYFTALKIEGDDESDPEHQGAIPFSERPSINYENLSIWKAGQARVFISHRDKHKAKVQELADALEDYGLSCFVAHETIPADQEWQKTIVNGLETMELMVAVLTDDFHESVFCMQEVGYALGRAVPVISLKVGQTDPLGFISHRQAQRGSLDEPLNSAKSLFTIIGERLRRLERLNEVLIASFCGAKDWYDAKDRFDRMKANVDTLNQEQIEQIVTAYASNNQLFNAIYLNNQYERLIKFMNGATDSTWVIEGTTLKKASKDSSYDDVEDIPF